MAGEKNLRKKSVVDTRVQWTLASRVLLHFFVFVCAGAIFGIINQFLADPFGGVEKNLAAFARQSAPAFLALMCLLPIFVRDTLTLTNRVAGPIHNLRNTMKRIGDGEDNVPPLRFRDGDFWSELPELFNTMRDRLEESGEPEESQTVAAGSQEHRVLAEV